jgi:hypothetical protein
MARKRATVDDALVMPTKERGRHDLIELHDMRDPEGWPVRVSRAVDTIGRLQRSGMINRASAKAGNRFRSEFHRAQLDPARAADMGRIPSNGRGSDVSDKIEDAKVGVWKALQAMGGMSSPAGSALWWIIGSGHTIQEWSRQQSFGRGTSLRHEVSTGILVGALSALAAHYEEVNRG